MGKVIPFRKPDRTKPTILVVEDDPGTLDILMEILEHFGFDCQGTDRPFEALDLIHNGQFDMVISNLHMPGMDGLELISKVREFDSKIPFLITSGYVKYDTPDRVLKAGAQDFLKKPFKPCELRNSVNVILGAC